MATRFFLSFFVFDLLSFVFDLSSYPFRFWSFAFCFSLKHNCHNVPSKIKTKDERFLKANQRPKIKGSGRPRLPYSGPFVACFTRSLSSTLWKIKSERIRRIPSHGVAALRAFGIDRGNPLRDCIDSLLIDLQGWFPFMINKVIKRNKESTPHLKGHLTIELNQINTCFTYQQVLYLASLWIGILLVHSTFFYQSVVKSLTILLRLSGCGLLFSPHY